MMLSLPKYDCYKDSGVDWLGEIPAHWQVKKLKYVSLFVTTGKTPPSSNQSYFDGDIDWFTPADFNENLYLKNSKRTITEKALLAENLKLYPPLSVLLIGIGATVGKIGIIQKSAFSNQQINAINFNQKLVNPIYGMYYLEGNKEKIKYFANVVTLPIFNQSDTKNLIILTPPLKEQERIVKFLDRKCEEVESAIALKQKLIILLEEQRAVLINEAVTKGLNPNAPMQDSGIDWLGDIPAHWEVKKLKYMGTAIIGLTYAPKDLTDENNGTLVLRSSNIQNGKICFKSNVFVKSKIPKHLITKRHDILICSRNGSRELIGKNALIEEKSIGLSFGAFTTVFRSHFNPFLYYIFNSNIFKSQSGLFLTSTINQLTTGTLNNFKIPIPPIEEQEKIVEYLEKKTAEIEELKEKTLEQIEKLKEFKQILIAEAVTGKIKV